MFEMRFEISSLKALASDMWKCHIMKTSAIKNCLVKFEMEVFWKVLSSSATTFMNNKSDESFFHGPVNASGLNEADCPGHTSQAPPTSKC